MKKERGGRGTFWRASVHSFILLPQTPPSLRAYEGLILPHTHTYTHTTTHTHTHTHTHTTHTQTRAHTHTHTHKHAHTHTHTHTNEYCRLPPTDCTNLCDYHA